MTPIFNKICQLYDGRKSKNADIVLSKKDFEDYVEAIIVPNFNGEKLKKKLLAQKWAYFRAIRVKYL
jgi:hypothetical protein